MLRCGTADEGFSLEMDDVTRALRVKAWGFWDQAIAGSFVQTVTDACNTGPGASTIVIEAVGLRPQREVGQRALGMLMAALARLGITRVDVTTDSSLTRLQLLRLAQENGARKLLHFREVKPQG